LLMHTTIKYSLYYYRQFVGKKFFCALILASLSTAPSRSKSSSLAIRNEEGKSHHAMKSKHNLPTASSGKTLVNGVQNAGKVKGDRNKPVTEKKNTSKYR
jgi:hypothetical protein